LEDGDTALYTIREGVIVLKKGAIVPNGFTIGV
jgi:glucose-1-phosphate adenylyltransferase